MPPGCTDEARSPNAPLTLMALLHRQQGNGAAAGQVSLSVHFAHSQTASPSIAAVDVVMALLHCQLGHGAVPGQVSSFEQCSPPSCTLSEHGL